MRCQDAENKDYLKVQLTGTAGLEKKVTDSNESDIL